MDRTTYIKKVYPKYWLTARERKYGFLEYDKNLCNLVLNLIGQPSNDKTLIEVAIGTGYPFADYFASKGYSVHGIDISQDLIEKSKRLYPDIKCKVGDAEHLDYPDDNFDFVYCFHSTWLFPNLAKAVDEMLRVAKPSGYVAFDIMNRNNNKIQNTYAKNVRENTGMGRIWKITKNIAKVILRRRTIDWHFVVYETPTYPEGFYGHLRTHSKVRDFSVFTRNQDGSLLEQKEVGPLPDWDRIVFVIHTK